MFFWALSRVVYVAFDRSKVFLLSVVLDPSEGCVGGSSCSKVFYVVFICSRSSRLFSDVLACFRMITFFRLYFDSSYCRIRFKFF